MSALGRRAVACKGWRWMPGMLALLHQRGRVHGRCRVEWVQSAPPSVPLPVPWASGAPMDTEGTVPDLTDAASRGCLLELVRVVWGPDHYVTLTPATPMGGQWEVSIENNQEDTIAVCLGATESEALVAALEAAP